MTLPDKLPEKPITLHAWGLCSKHGFSDGDILFDMSVDDYIDLKGIDSHEVLVRLVKDHLLVALPFDVEITENLTSGHNPARLKYDPVLEDELSTRLSESDVSVTLTAADVQQTIDTMIAEAGGA